MKSEAMLWTGIATGPIAWFVNLEVSFALAPGACTGPGKSLLHLAAALALLLTLAAGCLSFSQWHMPRADVAGEPTPFFSRRRAMALAGMGLSALFFLVTLAQAIPNLVLGGCE
jgi:hypothetical protein